MNFFKKALVATAVVASFGASAAKITPSTTIIEISKEGIAANVGVPTTGFNLDVKVEATTPAASNLKVVFGAGVDLSLLSLDGSVDNTVAGISKDSEMEITFGTGSFTFDNFAVDTTTAGAHFVTFDVSLGQPMNSGAAFNIKFTGATSASVAKAASATYTATDSGTLIDSGTGAISKEVDQFSAKVKTPLNELIKRDEAAQFLGGAALDTLAVEVTNDESLSRAIGFAGDDVIYTATVTGAFKDMVDAHMAPASAGHTNSVVTAHKVHKTIVAATTLPVDGTTGDILITYNLAIAPAIDIPVTSSVTVNVDVTSATDLASPLTILTKGDAGQWKIDATIINVPYFPVGYTGVQSTVILANEGTVATDVIVTAIDQDGEEYGPVNLNTATAFSTDLPAKTVSKVSDVLLMDLLGAPASTKLSVTFNIDANEGVVNGYAYTQKDGTGRSEVSTSQQHGK